MNKGKDRASKLFFSDPSRASDIVSLALRRLGVEAELSEITIEDPVVSFLKRKISMEKLFDKLYKVTLSDDEGSTFCFMGLENQSKYDAHMLIRAGIASLLVYDWKISLKEELKPNFIVVLNMSDRKWKGPTTLEDYFSKGDLRIFGPLMVNVRMVVIDPHAMDDSEIESLKTDLELVLKVIKNKRDKRAFCDYIKSDKRFTKLDEVTIKLISEIINLEIDEGEDDMCKAIEDLIKDSRAEGRAEGRVEGRAEGEASAYYKLRREGHLSREVAAKNLGLSIEEYTRRENRFFS